MVFVKFSTHETSGKRSTDIRHLCLKCVTIPLVGHCHEINILSFITQHCLFGFYLKNYKGESLERNYFSQGSLCHKYFKLFGIMFLIIVLAL